MPEQSAAHQMEDPDQQINCIQGEKYENHRCDRAGRIQRRH